MPQITDWRQLTSWVVVADSHPVVDVSAWFLGAFAVEGVASNTLTAFPDDLGEVAVGFEIATRVRETVLTSEGSLFAVDPSIRDSTIDVGVRTAGSKVLASAKNC